MRRIALLLATLAFSTAGKTSLAAEPKVEEVRLENGTTVLLRPIAGASGTALVVVFSIGADQDAPEACGLAHLVEHLYVTSAAGKAPARTADEWMKAHPLGTNAQTGDDYTVIATVFEPAALGAEVEDAAARMGDLRITDADLAREVPRIREEVENMHGGLPALAAVNLAREGWREQARPCARRGGDPDAIASVPLAKVRERLARFYRPGNAIVAIAGAFDAASARALVTKAFERLPRGEAPPALGMIGTPAPADARERAAASPPRVVPHEVRSKVAGLPRIVCLAVAARPLAEATGPAAAQLVVATRLLARAAEAGAKPMPPPVWFAPLDAPDSLCLSAVVAANETPDVAVARLEATLAGAVKGKPTPDDVVEARNTFGFLLGLGDRPDAVLAQKPYGVAFGLARRKQTGLDPQKLDAALRGVTEDDLRRAFPNVAGVNPAVVVIPK